MGTIVYSNLVDLLLEEGDKTKEELIKESIERFGFPQERLSFNIGIQLMIKEKEFITQLENGKYHLLKVYNGMIGRESLLERLNNVPNNYFKARPHIKKLKIALEEKNIK